MKKLSLSFHSVSVGIRNMKYAYLDNIGFKNLFVSFRSFWQDDIELFHPPINNPLIPYSTFSTPFRPKHIFEQNTNFRKSKLNQSIQISEVFL